MAFTLRITDLGRAALADGANRGTNAIRLTKMVIGDGQGPGGEADDGRAALRNQRAAVALVGSTMVSGRIAVRGEFNPAAAYGVTELGLLGRVGAGAEELYAYWTDAGALLASTVDGTRLVIAGSLDIAPAAAEVMVTVDATITLGDPALSGAVTALGGRVDTAETDIDALEAEGFGALITALAARVATLESSNMGYPTTSIQQAHLIQDDPVAGQWYTVLDRSGAGVLFHLRTLGARRGHDSGSGFHQVAIRITVDGQVSVFPWDSQIDQHDRPVSGGSNNRKDIYGPVRHEASLRVEIKSDDTGWTYSQGIQGKAYYGVDI